MERLRQAGRGARFRRRGTRGTWDCRLYRQPPRSEAFHAEPGSTPQAHSARPLPEPAEGMEGRRHRPARGPALDNWRSHRGSGLHDNGSVRDGLRGCQRLPGKRSGRTRKHPDCQVGVLWCLTGSRMAWKDPRRLSHPEHGKAWLPGQGSKLPGSHPGAPPSDGLLLHCGLSSRPVPATENAQGVGPLGLRRRKRARLPGIRIGGGDRRSKLSGTGVGNLAPAQP